MLSSFQAHPTCPHLLIWMANLPYKMPFGLLCRFLSFKLASIQSHLLYYQIQKLKSILSYSSNHFLFLCILFIVFIPLSEDRWWQPVETSATVPANCLLVQFLSAHTSRFHVIELDISLGRTLVYEQVTRLAIFHSFCAALTSHVVNDKPIAWTVQLASHTHTPGLCQ